MKVFEDCCRSSRGRALRLLPGATLLLVLSAGPVLPQTGSPTRPSSPEGPDVWKEIEELKREIEELKKNGLKVEDQYSKGIHTWQGFKFRLKGRLKINYVDVESENDPVFGLTDNPDPHLELDKLRLIPRIEAPKLGDGVELFARAQIDFRPDGRSRLKEATFDYEATPNWWFSSHLKFGLDDRFIRPNRWTDTYPLAGTAFWRDESVALFWEGKLGAKRGRKIEKRDRPARVDASTSEKLTSSRAPRTRSTHHEPFDFRGNPGAARLHLSYGNGYTLDGKEQGVDNARFNDILQHDRELESSLSLNELGVGLGYSRDFRQFGEIDLLGFYYNGELSDESVVVLQNELTLRDPLSGAALSGYGDSEDDTQYFHGVNLEYHYSAYHLWQHLGILDTMAPRTGDGLYLFYQWISGRDGELDRDTWYVQASYRYSPNWDSVLLRSIEPVLRYGELSPDVEHIPTLPLTWNRRKILLGAILEIVEDVYIRIEYSVHHETTGAGDVKNNEFLTQLYVRF